MNEGGGGGHRISVRPTTTQAPTVRSSSSPSPLITSGGEGWRVGSPLNRRGGVITWHNAYQTLLMGAPQPLDQLKGVSKSQEISSAPATPSETSKSTFTPVLPNRLRHSRVIRSRRRGNHMIVSASSSHKDFLPRISQPTLFPPLMKPLSKEKEDEDDEKEDEEEINHLPASPSSYPPRLPSATPQRHSLDYESSPYNTSSAEARELLQGHKEFTQTLSRRLAGLQLARRVCLEEGPPSSILFASMSGDCSVIIDLARAMVLTNDHQHNESMHPDTAAAWLASIPPSLSSSYDEYIVVGLAVVRIVLPVLAQLLDAASSFANSIGVEAVPEELKKRCSEYHTNGQKILQLVEPLIKREGEIGEDASDVANILEEFLAKPMVYL